MWGEDSPISPSSHKRSLPDSKRKLRVYELGKSTPTGKGREKKKTQVLGKWKKRNARGKKGKECSAPEAQNHRGKIPKQNGYKTAIAREKERLKVKG